MTDTATHAAPESASAFLYQLDRAVYHLAVSSAQATVGVETDDDVAVLAPDGKGILEQDKLSNQGTGHPFQDRGKGLWNTLLIWLQAARDGEERHRVAELHMVTNRPVPSRALVWRIGQASRSDDEVKACVAELRKIARDPAKSMADLMAAVCAFDDDAISAVIRRVRVRDSGSATDGPALRQKIVDALHIPPELNSGRVVQAMLEVDPEFWTTP